MPGLLLHIQHNTAHSMGFAKDYREFIFHPRESRQLQKLSSTDEKPTADVSHLSAVNISSASQKKELKERDAWDKLGYSFPTYKKWYILLVLFFIRESELMPLGGIRSYSPTFDHELTDAYDHAEISINLNASLYANGVTAISKEYGISEQAARVPQVRRDALEDTPQTDLNHSYLSWWPMRLVVYCVSVFYYF